MLLTPEDEMMTVTCGQSVQRQGPKAEPCLSPRLSDDDDGDDDDDDDDVELHVLGCRMTH